MLAHPVFVKMEYDWYGNKERIHIRHYTLEVLLLMAYTSADYDLSAKDIYHTFYVGSSFVLYKANWVVWKKKTLIQYIIC